MKIVTPRMQSCLRTLRFLVGGFRVGLVLLGTAALVSAANAGGGWSLVWSDEFTQPDGSSPDSTRWAYDLGGGGWGNNELETYTSRTNNCRIENGQLVIEARKENYTGTDGIARSFTSARLKTKGKATWTYGRIEARLKVPRGQGLWPAFWMLGANIDSAGWPTCGEIDIMENIGAEPSIVHGTIHGPGYSGGSGIGGGYTLAGGAVFADDFHVFAVEWETNRMRWYVDDQLYFTATPTNLPSGKTWVFTQPQFLLLNLAVGGNWPGNPNASTTFPQRLTVDYVRVYAATNAPGGGGNALANPGFEVGGLANWTRYGANTYLQSSNYLPVHSGSNVFKVYGQFNGSDNYSGIYQDLAAYAGLSYSARIWALTPSGDRIAGDNAAWGEVSFRDTSNHVLASFRTSLITASSPAGAWLNLAATNQLNPADSSVIGSVTNLIAPNGTAFARFQLVFHQPAFAAGAVLFDDLAFSQLPGVTPLAIGSFLTNGATPSVRITFPTWAGVEYQVLYKDDLADSAWQRLDTILGNGLAKSVIQSPLTNRRFFRVIAL